ncbi:hypothetical protein SNEBB_000409 [Seison nebaliae]|nr:hypothetical protein SNEBB_000409 [Seison nebaliae]
MPTITSKKSILKRQKNEKTIDRFSKKKFNRRLPAMGMAILLQLDEEEALKMSLRKIDKSENGRKIIRRNDLNIGKMMKLKTELLKKRLEIVL